MTEETWKTCKALLSWVLIKNICKRESKEKRIKERGTTTKKVYHHPRIQR